MSLALIHGKLADARMGVCVRGRACESLSVSVCIRTEFDSSCEAVIQLHATLFFSLKVIINHKFCAPLPLLS